MGKHTPGPWGQPKDFWETIDDCVGEDLWQLAHIGNAGNDVFIEVSGNNAESNARLIAKAPDMYELLKICEVRLSTDGEVGAALAHEIQSLLREIDKGGEE